MKIPRSTTLNHNDAGDAVSSTQIYKNSKNIQETLRIQARVWDNHGILFEGYMANRKGVTLDVVRFVNKYFAFRVQENYLSFVIFLSYLYISTYCKLNLRRIRFSPRSCRDRCSNFFFENVSQFVMLKGGDTVLKGGNTRAWVIIRGIQLVWRVSQPWITGT